MNRNELQSEPTGSGGSPERRRIFRHAAVFLFFIVLITIISRKFQETDRKDAEGKIRDGFQVLLPGTEISALYDDGEALWVGGKDGIMLLDRLTGEFLSWIAEDIKMIYAAAILKTDDGTIWAGHNNGLTGFLSDGTRAEFSAPEISGGRLNALYAEDNMLWAGTMEGASLLSLTENGWEAIRVLTKVDGLAANPVNVIAGTGGQIWFGSYLDSSPGGISILNAESQDLVNGKEIAADRWEYLSKGQGLPHPYINAVLFAEAVPADSAAVSADGRVYIAVGQLLAGGLAKAVRRNGILQIEDIWNTADGIPGEKVRWLFEDGKGRLWITTESDGVLVCPDADLVSHPLEGICLTEDDGLSDNEIKCIVETEDCYWLGGRYGLTKIEKGAF